MQVAIRVLLPLPLPPFDYLTPFSKDTQEANALPKVGSRVVVPWQQGIRLGLVVGHKDIRGGEGLTLREAIAVLDSDSFISANSINLIETIADYTCTPAGVVLNQLIPVGLQLELKHEVKAIAENSEANSSIPSDRWTMAEKVSTKDLEFFRQQGLIEERITELKPQTQVMVPLKAVDKSLEGKAQINQRLALEALHKAGFVASGSELSRLANVPESSVRTLVKKNYAGYEQRDAEPPPLLTFPPIDFPKTASDGLASSKNFDNISGGNRVDRLVALLPKIKAYLEVKKQVLILVPESIFVEETASYLASQVPTFSISGEAKDRQRLALFEELELASVQKQGCVLVGTYLALLAPLKNLGMIVVLEHGSGSYKLQAGSRIFIPKAAEFLANISKVPLVLSDALDTPEMLHRSIEKASQEKRSFIASNKQRLHIVDLNTTKDWPLSADLIRVLKQIDERNRQAIILSPRRGFSAAIRCINCMWMAECPNCDLSLRYHRKNYELRCHQCGHKETTPDMCPSCGQTGLNPTRAAGTQWIVDAIRKLFPEQNILRFDNDQKDDLSPLYAGESGILVATTAIMRQPPLPNISLIAHTLLDTHFELGDFRASESLYRLLLNLAELAPDKRPLVLLQSFQPEHPVLQSFQEEDSEVFLDNLLARRKLFGYPPFSSMAKVQLTARNEAAAKQASSWLANALITQGAEDAELLGPTPAPVLRLKGQYSYQLFIKTTDFDRLKHLLQPAIHFRGAARVRIDIDPREMLSFLDE